MNSADLNRSSEHDAHVIFDHEDGLPTGDCWAECACGWYLDINGNVERTEREVARHLLAAAEPEPEATS